MDERRRSSAGALQCCPRCKLGTLNRVGREGFLENSLYSRFGYYPWICAECKARVMIKVRGEKVRKRRRPSPEIA